MTAVLYWANGGWMSLSAHLRIAASFAYHFAETGIQMPPVMRPQPLDSSLIHFTKVLAAARFLELPNDTKGPPVLYVTAFFIFGRTPTPYTRPSLREFFSDTPISHWPPVAMATLPVRSVTSRLGMLPRSPTEGATCCFR